MNIIDGAFGILVIKSNNSNEVDVKARFDAFANDARRVMGVVRVNLSRDSKAIVVLTEVENMSAIAAMCTAHTLKVDVSADCYETTASA